VIRRLQLNSRELCRAPSRGLRRYRTFGSRVRMSKIRKLPSFEQSLGATLLMARESVMAPLRPVLRDHNVTEPQWRVLRVINDRGSTDATDLAEVGLLHAPSVTRILKELEDRGLIGRESDPNDRRRLLIALSPAGREVIRSISKPMLRILREYSIRFGADRLQRLENELRALSAVIKGLE
jgi:homoprotocatechuate degradation regulator HpaR